VSEDACAPAHAGVLCMDKTKRPSPKVSGAKLGYQSRGHPKTLTLVSSVLSGYLSRHGEGVGDKAAGNT